MWKFLIPLFALVILVGCTPQTTTQTDSYTTSSSAMTDGSSASTDAMAASSVSSMTAAQTSSEGTLSGKHTVILKTTKGDITLELDADAAPKTVMNFITLAKRGYYDELKFHRVIPDFMIQGGDPDGNGTGGESIYGESFEDEPNDLKMERGVLAMANRGPDTNGSQFFITVIATDWLQGRHTIFGKVTKGMDIVDALSKVQSEASEMPTTPVTYTVEVK